MVDVVCPFTDHYFILKLHDFLYSFKTEKETVSIIIHFCCVFFSKRKKEAFIRHQNTVSNSVNIMWLRHTQLLSNTAFHCNMYLHILHDFMSLLFEFIPSFLHLRMSVTE